MRAATAAALLASAATAAGHGMLISPPPRNSVDRSLPEFANGRYPHDTSDGCNCATSSGGCPAAVGPRAVANGQPCLWFSQGCTIGCPSCTSLHGHTNKSLCANPTTTATLNETALRTMNVNAVAGSVDDVYLFNPWRAPGTAPVEDACGMAGGSPSRVGPDAAVFAATAFAKQGDLGSKVLKPAPSGTVWTAGSTVEVAWGIRYNHGGGYSYRLCPATEPLTEACFQKVHLDFVGMPSLRWNDGKEQWFKGTYVSNGTHPPGSMWARNPIPRINDSPWDSGSPGWGTTPDSGSPTADRSCRSPAATLGCRQFDPVCEEVHSDPQYPLWHKIEPNSRSGDIEGLCSGDWTGGMIVDRVRIPAGLPPGDYVLGWRWDCEETAQIWASCADVSIAAGPAPPPAPVPPYTPPPPSDCTVAADTDTGDDEYISVPAADAGKCCNLCEADARCRLATYVYGWPGGTCYLKDSTHPVRKSAKGVVLVFPHSNNGTRT